MNEAYRLAALSDVCKISYGKSPSEIRMTQSHIPIIATSGVVGWASEKLFDPPFILVGRKGTIDNPIYCVNPAWVTDTAFAVHPLPNVDAKWLYYVLKNSHLERLNEATGVPSLSREAIYATKVPFPSQIEQKTIAEVLSALDRVIDYINVRLEKTLYLKRGLLSSIFFPFLYKEAAQQLSKNNEVVLLDAVAKRGSGHTPDRNTAEYWNGGIPWVSLADTFRLDQGFISETEYEISEAGINNSSAVLHPANTVVMTRDASVGKVAVLSKPMAVSQHFMAWRCSERLDPWFLYYQLFHWRTQIEGIAIGSTIKTIGLPYFKKLKIVLPPIENQRRSAKILLDADLTINSLKLELRKFQQLRTGLMNDLLSGRVRLKG